MDKKKIKDKKNKKELNDQEEILEDSSNEVAEETVESKYAGEEIEIAFNVNYIQEILNNQTNENCNVLFFGSDKSCLILPPGGEFPKYVVMPLLL